MLLSKRLVILNGSAQLDDDANSAVYLFVNNKFPGT